MREMIDLTTAIADMKLFNKHANGQNMMAIIVQTDPFVSEWKK